MSQHYDQPVIQAIQATGIPLETSHHTYDQLLDTIGDARFVLIGEASHGTHEFYQERAKITSRLITEKGFTAVAIEADWPDTYRVNRYVRGLSVDKTGREALSSFTRFPTWMWGNTEVLRFVDWLRQHNDMLEDQEQKVGFYGLDLYSLYTSVDAVISYLGKVNPEAAERARRRYACLEHYGGDARFYLTSLQLDSSCEKEVLKQLLELQQLIALSNQYSEESFYVDQNARLVSNAEKYYRAMLADGARSWNIRDHHMVDTLDFLLRYLDRQHIHTKVVVWAHNSHLGDARATYMGKEGEQNVGQLVRQRYEAQAFLLGFTTYTGTVTAASNWDRPAERKHVRPALEGSYESLFHYASFVLAPNFYLLLQSPDQTRSFLQEPRLERAIGVVYRPYTERASHYFEATLPEQFDAVIHLDRTHALEPLVCTPQWIQGEPEETYPTGL
ncbi:erythromycin esterase family protein [Dictyobacter kobayashii]|uniref:Erythromycin esterase n=1 Tax=Dictyobacter kobayashii TaxID=2014872 RepID=A0A402ASR5_9CHLR|nr:erythromycin esterase family protein [Dictyobacter kobayashii]GCE22150.1 hypothetical protein KDK_59500 [Dictyobacter kobayashii]